MNVSNYGADLIICKCLFLVSPKIVLGSALSWSHCQRLAQIPFLPRCATAGSHRDSSALETKTFRIVLRAGSSSGMKMARRLHQICINKSVPYLHLFPREGKQAALIPWCWHCCWPPE